MGQFILEAPFDERDDVYELFIQDVVRIVQFWFSMERNFIKDASTGFSSLIEEDTGKLLFSNM